MKKVISIIISIIFSVLIWNVIIGLYILKLPLVYQTSEIGKHYQPKSEITWGSEGFSRLITDEYGYNNNLGYSLNPDILVLGDSHTEAIQIDRNHNFCSILQRQLSNKCKVYNMGVSGNSIADYIYYGNNILQKFNPDKVIIQITEDDFFEDAVDKNRNVYISSKNSKYSIVVNNNRYQNIKFIKDKVVAFSSFTALFYDKIKKNSARNQIKSKPFLPQALVKNYSEKTENNEEYIKLVNWELENLKIIYQNKLIILYLPATPSISNNKILLTKPSFKKNIIFSQCIKLDILLISMEDPFISYFQKHREFPRGFSNSLPGTGHLNKTGHLLTGQKLAQYLKNKGI